MKPKIQFTDSYEVKFTIKGNDEFWDQTTKIYHTNGKDQHKQIEKIWRDEYKGKQVRLVSVIYY